jgi:hypothetical protein
MLKVTQQDLTQVKNLQKFLGKAKAELEGQEILAAADVLCWVANIKKRIEDSLTIPVAQADLPASPPIATTGRKKPVKMKG